MKILKILIAVWLCLQLGLKLEAQSMKFGFLSGLVVSNAQVTNKINIYDNYRVYYPMISFNINGYCEYRISKMWGISAEPGFIRKGGIVRFGVNHYTSSIKMQLNYVQLPILANFYFANKFFISIGPEFAYLFNHNENLPGTETGLFYFEENAFEISGLIGLNFSISKSVDLGLRYSHGITPVAVLKWTDGYGPVIDESKVYNQYFQLIIRYKITTGANNSS